MRAAGPCIRTGLISAIVAISLAVPVLASYASNIEVLPVVPASKLRIDYVSEHTKEKVKSAYIGMIREEGAFVGEAMIVDLGGGRACAKAYEDFINKISLRRVLAVRTLEISPGRSAVIIEKDGYYHCLATKGNRLFYAKAKSEEASLYAIRLVRVKGGFPGGFFGKVVLLALIIWAIKSFRKQLGAALAGIFRVFRKPRKILAWILILVALCFVFPWALRVGKIGFYYVRHIISRSMTAKEQPAEMPIESGTADVMVEEEIPAPADMPEEAPVPAEEIRPIEPPAEEAIEVPEQPTTQEVPPGPAVSAGPPYIQDEGEDLWSFLSRNEVMLDLGNRYYTEIRLGDWHPDKGEFTHLSNPYSFTIRGRNSAGDAAVISFAADINFQNGLMEKVYQYYFIVRNPDRTWKVIATHQSVTEELVERYGIDPEAGY